MKLSIEAPESEIAEPGEVHLHIRFRPANLFGIVAVLLIHALLLFFLLHMQPPKKQKQGDEAGSRNPMVLILDKAVMAKLAPPEVKKSRAKPPPLHVAQNHAKPAARQAPQIAAQTVVQQASPMVVETPPQQDMMSMLNAARQRRQAQEQAASAENAAAGATAHAMSPQEVAEANVRHSMRQAAGRDGANGVFQIINKSTRMASFSFRGWRPNSNSSWKQVIEVDAGLGGNIDLAIVKRMIVLIRTEYQGDFSWESHRLGRVVNLSARPQDNTELEAFMLREFFG